MKIITDYLDGAAIAYTPETDFVIQIGKGKSGYKTVSRVVGDLARALAQYRGFNIGNGCKKRLVMPSCSKKPVLARHIS